MIDANQPITLTFTTIDRIVGGLPRSAREHRAWWANDTVGTYSHATSWMRAGRRVSRVDFNAGSVTFERAV